MTDDSNLVIPVLTEEFSQPQKAGIAIRKDGRVEFKINLFPIVLRLAGRRVKSLRIKEGREHYERTNGYWYFHFSSESR